MARNASRWPRLAALVAFLLAVGVSGYWAFGWLTTTPPTRANLSCSDISDRNVLDQCLPEGATGPVPVVVWVHGGAFLTWDKNVRRLQIARIGDRTEADSDSVAVEPDRAAGLGVRNLPGQIRIVEPCKRMGGILCEQSGDCRVNA